jgi:optic atrophy 3 protein
MRLRLGLLHDPEAQRKMHEREQRAAEEKKRKAEAPTVRSEEEQKKYDEQQARAQAAGQKPDADVKKEEKKPRVRIKPLSDARAIELGANFFSEAFIFLVAVSLILAENYRSSRKSSQRRDEVAERLEALEAQVERLQQEHHLPELEALNDKIKKAREARKTYSWYNPAGWWTRTEIPDDDDDEGIPGEVESPGDKGIPGNVPGPSPARAVKAKAESTKPVEAKTSSDDATSPPAPQRVDSVHANSKGR